MASPPAPGVAQSIGSEGGEVGGEEESTFVRPQAPTPKWGSRRGEDIPRPGMPEVAKPAPSSEERPKKSGVLKSSREYPVEATLTTAYPRSRIQTLQFPSTSHFPTGPPKKLDVFASSPPSSWRWEPPLVLERADPFDSEGRDEGKRDAAKRSDGANAEVSERPLLQRFPPYKSSPDTSFEVASSPDTSNNSESHSSSSPESKERVGSTPAQPPRRKKKKSTGKIPKLPAMPNTAPVPLSASVGAERLSLLFQPLSPATTPFTSNNRLDGDTEAPDTESPSPSRPTTPTPTRPKTPLVHTPPRSTSLPAHYRSQAMGPRLKPLTPITPEKPVTPSKLRRKPGQVTRLRSKKHLRDSPTVAPVERSPTPTPVATRDFSSTLPGRTTPFPPLGRSPSPTPTVGSVAAGLPHGEGITVTSVTVQEYRPVDFEGEGLRRGATPTRKRFSLFDEEWFRSPRSASASASAIDSGTGATRGTVTAGVEDTVRSAYSTMGHTAGNGTIDSLQTANGKAKTGDDKSKGNELHEPTWVTRLFRRPSSPRPRSPSITSLLSSPTRPPPSPLRPEPESPSKFKASLSKAKTLRLSSLRSKTTAPVQPLAPEPTQPSTPRRPSQAVEKPSPSKSERWLKKSRSKASLRSLLHLRSSSDSSSSGEKEGWCTECGERCTRHSPHTRDPFANLSNPDSFPNTPLLPSNAGAVMLPSPHANLRENAPWGAQRVRTLSNVSVTANGERSSGSEGWHVVGVRPPLAPAVPSGQFGSVRLRTRSNVSTHSYPPYPSHSHSLSYPPDQYTRRRSVSLTAPRRVAHGHNNPGPPGLRFRDQWPITIPEQREDADAEDAEGEGEGAYMFPPPPPKPEGGFPPLPPLPPLPWSKSGSSSSGATYHTTRSQAHTAEHRSNDSHSHDGRHSANSQYSQTSAAQNDPPQNANSDPRPFSTFPLEPFSFASAGFTPTWVVPSQPVPQRESPEVSQWSDDEE